jgi:hypothetical protein
MRFRVGSVHWILGWLLTILGVAAFVLGVRGYWTGEAVRPGWVLGGLLGIVAGTALVRWVRRTRSE